MMENSAKKAGRRPIAHYAIAIKHLSVSKILKMEEVTDNF